MKTAIKNRPFCTSNSERQRGLTLTELLVAMLLGLFIVGGSIGLFVTNKTVYTDTGRITELQDNARFAQKYLLDDLRHAYFFGEKHYDTFTPDLDSSTPSNSAVQDNCTGGAAVYSFNGRSNPPGVPLLGATAASGDAIGCIDDAARVVGIPSDVLVLKMVLPQPLKSTDDLVLGNLYIASNRTDGFLRLHSADVAMPTLSGTCVGRTEDCLRHGTYWPYAFRAYYIRDPDPLDGEPPMLARKTLAWDSSNGVSVVSEDLVEGVEGMRILYAEAGDGAASSFVDAASVADWQEINAVRIYLLVRTVEPDPGYRDTATYVLGDTSTTKTSSTELSQGGAELRNFHRRVVSTTVLLRNKPIIDGAGPDS